MKIKLGDVINNKKIIKITGYWLYPNHLRTLYSISLNNCNPARLYTRFNCKVVITLDDDTKLAWNQWMWQFDKFDTLAYSDSRKD